MANRSVNVIVNSPNCSLPILTDLPANNELGAPMVESCVWLPYIVRAAFAIISWMKRGGRKNGAGSLDDWFSGSYVGLLVAFCLPLAVDRVIDDSIPSFLVCSSLKGELKLHLALKSCLFALAILQPMMNVHARFAYISLNSFLILPQTTPLVRTMIHAIKHVLHCNVPIIPNWAHSPISLV